MWSYDHISQSFYKAIIPAKKVVKEFIEKGFCVDPFRDHLSAALWAILMMIG